jgi:acetyl esterase/lipase
LEAVRWVYNNVSRRIIIAGASAGGHVAFTTAASPLCPKPLALLSIYGMVDFSNTRYVHPGRRLLDGIPNEGELLKEIDAAIESGKFTDAQPPPPNFAMGYRFKWASTLYQTARYIDVLTRSPGLTEKIAKEGIQVVPEEHRPLFPATFGLNANFPPTILIHGDADVLVDFELSSSVAKKFQIAGLDVYLERVPSQGHGFDASEDLNVDAESSREGLNATLESLKRVVEILERYTKES